MEAFSCSKCGQVVEAAKMPHSCPRCYSPASEAYAIPSEVSHDASGRHHEPPPLPSEALLPSETEPLPGTVSKSPPPPPLPEDVPALPEDVLEPLAVKVQRATRPKDKPHRRAQRIPTAQVMRVSDSLRDTGRRRLLVLLWAGGVILVGLAILRLSFYDEDRRESVTSPRSPVASFHSVDASHRPDGAELVASRTADASTLSMEGLARGAETTPPSPASTPFSSPMASQASSPGRPGRATSTQDPSEISAPRRHGTPSTTARREASRRRRGRPDPGRLSTGRSGDPLATKKAPKGGHGSAPAPMRPGSAKVAGSETSPPPGAGAKKPETPPRDPNASLAARHATAQGLYRKGVQKLLWGQPNNALVQFQRALKVEPSFALAYRGIGLAYQKMGNRPKARGAFRRYLALRPKAPDAASIRARLLSLE